MPEPTEECSDCTPEVFCGRHGAEEDRKTAEMWSAAAFTQPDYGTGEKPPCGTCGGKGTIPVHMFGPASDLVPADCPGFAAKPPCVVIPHDTGLRYLQGEHTWEDSWFLRNALEKAKATGEEPADEDCRCTWDNVGAAEGIVAYNARCPQHGDAAIAREEAAADCPTCKTRREEDERHGRPLFPSSKPCPDPWHKAAGEKPVESGKGERVTLYSKAPSMATEATKRKDWSMLSAWCEKSAELESTESWMCAPPDHRQEWEGAEALYLLFAEKVNPSELDVEAIQRWLDGAKQAATQIAERVTRLAERERSDA